MSRLVAAAVLVLCTTTLSWAQLQPPPVAPDRPPVVDAPAVSPVAAPSRPAVPSYAPNTLVGTIVTNPSPTPSLSPFKYKAYFDSEQVALKTTFDNRAANNGRDVGLNYYDMQGPIGGNVSMAEALLLAGQDASPYIERVLTWYETMMTRATIIDASGYKWWSGAWATNPNSQVFNVCGATNASPIVITTCTAHNFVTGQFIYVQGVGGNTAANSASVSSRPQITRLNSTQFQLNGTTGNGTYTSGGTVRAPTSFWLYDFQGSNEIARMARIIKGDNGLNATYGTRADTILDFVENNIVDKHFIGISGETGFMNRCTLLQFRFIDQQQLAVSTIVELIRAGRDTYKTGRTYTQLITDCLNGYVARISSPADNGISAANADIYDYNHAEPLGIPGGQSGDTSHENRWPQMLIRAYDAGFTAQITKTHLERVANLYSRIIWNRSISSPAFTNIIDGDNPTVTLSGTAYAPYTLGVVWNFVSLARFSADALLASESAMDCVIAGAAACSSPGMTGPSGGLTNPFNRAHMAGNITLARALFELDNPSSGTPPQPPTVTAFKYKAYLDARIEASYPTYLSRSTTEPSNSETIYDLIGFRSYIHGLLSMFEATLLLEQNGLGAKDVSYLEKALDLMEGWTNRPVWDGVGACTGPGLSNCPSQDKIVIDSNGYKNFGTSYNTGIVETSSACGTTTVRVANALTEQGGLKAFARGVRIIKSNPELNATYGARATAIGDLVDHMMKHRLVACGYEGAGSYGGLVDDNSYFDTRILAMVETALHLSAAGYGEFRPGKTYAALMADWWPQLLANKLSSPNFTAPCDSGLGECPAPTISIQAAGAALFNFQVSPFDCGQVPNPCTPDTSHYAPWVSSMVFAYQLGYVPFSLIQQTTNLFTKVLWDGSLSVPRIRNYTDGYNKLYRNVRLPWENGEISGMTFISRYDPAMLQLTEALMDCVLASCGSPSIVYLNNADNNRVFFSATNMLARLQWELSGSYIENLTTRLVATDAYRPSSGNAGAHNTRISTAAGTDYYVLTYMDNTGGENGAHNQFPIMCSYLTGDCTKGPTLGLKDPTCCDGHDVGGIFRDPLDSRLIGFYGALDAATHPSAPSDGPFYKVSVNPNDPASWGSETRAPAEGSISELMGGFDDSGDFFGCGQSQWGGAYGRAFALRCIKRVSGVWSDITLVEVGTNDGAQGSSGDPGCVPFVKVFPNGEVYVMWERSFSGCSAANTDLFFVKSTDKTQFCNVAGGDCFTPTENTGLLSTWNGTSHDYPATYRVVQSTGMSAGAFFADKLDDGTPFVVYGRSGNTYFRKYTGSWTAEVLAASGESSPGCLLVKPNGNIKFYTGFTNIDEFTSVDRGANWATARIHTLGEAGETGNRPPGCRYYSNLGGKPRIILTWPAETSSVTATAVATKDLPQ